MTAADVTPLWEMLLLDAVRRYLCDNRKLPRGFVEDMAAETARLAPSGLGVRTIRDAEGFAGFVAVKPVPPDVSACIPAFRGELEVSIGLHPSRWSRGLAREAVVAALEDWREHGDGRRVVAVADEPNARSRRMLSGLGFAEAGVFHGSAYPLVAYVPKMETS